MKTKLLAMVLAGFYTNAFAQSVGIGTTLPATIFHVKNGTSWFQGDNTPLPSYAGTGIAMGFTPGATGGYLFGFDYQAFSPKNLWLQSPGGSVLIGSSTSSPGGRLYVVSSSDHAIYGTATSSGYGVIGTTSSGFGGYFVSATNSGVVSYGGYIGVQGNANGSSTDRQAVRGELPNNTGYAGIFVNGTTAVFGTLTKSAGAFLIDHPLEPEKKYLVHSFVESPDMKNIYDGVVTTDSSGYAKVELPKWFEALNMDYRYQLTCIGTFAQAIVEQEIKDNCFYIKTDKPHVKVSWQVTGIRHDAYANDNRLEVEKLKKPNEVGKYIYPAGFGQPQDKLLDILKPIAKNN